MPTDACQFYRTGKVASAFAFAMPCAVLTRSATRQNPSRKLPLHAHLQCVRVDTGTGSLAFLPSSCSCCAMISVVHGWKSALQRRWPSEPQGLFVADGIAAGLVSRAQQRWLGSLLGAHCHARQCHAGSPRLDHAVRPPRTDDSLRCVSCVQLRGCVFAAHCMCARCSAILSASSIAFFYDDEPGSVVLERYCVCPPVSLFLRQPIAANIDSVWCVRFGATVLNSVPVDTAGWFLCFCMACVSLFISALHWSVPLPIACARFPGTDFLRMLMTITGGAGGGGSEGEVSRIHRIWSDAGVHFMAVDTSLMDAGGRRCRHSTSGRRLPEIHHHSAQSPSHAWSTSYDPVSRFLRHVTIARIKKYDNFDKAGPRWYRNQQVLAGSLVDTFLLES